MNPFKKLIEIFNAWRDRRALNKRLKELRKRDPFIY
jgi:hypothetical protein